VLTGSAGCDHGQETVAAIHRYARKSPHASSLKPAFVHICQREYDFRRHCECTFKRYRRKRGPTCRRNARLILARIATGHRTLIPTGRSN
jgi:hypothetical protein